MTTVQRFNFKTEEVSIISKTWESVAKQRRERERERESEARSFLSFGANHQQKEKKIIAGGAVAEEVLASERQKGCFCCRQGATACSCAGVKMAEKKSFFLVRRSKLKKIFKLFFLGFNSSSLRRCLMAITPSISSLEDMSSHLPLRCVCVCMVSFSFDHFISSEVSSSTLFSHLVTFLRQFFLPCFPLSATISIRRHRRHVYAEAQSCLYNLMTPNISLSNDVRKSSCRLGVTTAAATNCSLSLWCTIRPNHHHHHHWHTFSVDTADICHQQTTTIADDGRVLAAAEKEERLANNLFWQSPKQSLPQQSSIGKQMAPPFP